MQGGVVVKLVFRGTSFAFVCAHLAAHTQYVQHRNANFREIVHETRKHIGARALDILSEFDHVLWMGDLNYRVDLNMGKDPPPFPDTEAHFTEVCAMIRRRDWNALLAADQLRWVRRKGEAFSGFQEGKINFAPTFKVERQRGTRFVLLCCDVGVNAQWETLACVFVCAMMFLLLRLSHFNIT